MFGKLLLILSKIKTWQIACFMIILSFTVFFSGLNGGFQGDDTDQIIKNEAVHSISNIGLFFKSSTFWNGETLVGDFYRPTMTTVYSLVYTFFGANPTAYHVVQLLIYTAAAFILFLFLKQFFRIRIALLLATIFLIHPINTQIVYSIPSMQEPLMLIFGISGLYVLTKTQTTKNLAIATFLLFMSLMSKETAIVFVCAAVLYLLIYNRARVLSFIKLMTLPFILYLIIRISVVGFRHITNSAQVDFLSFWERMTMVPSLIMFYITKFFYPRDLATSYYWTHKTISFDSFILPFLIILIGVIGLALIGWFIYKKSGRKGLSPYLFFAGWAILGLMPHLQIIALDMTACETWSYLMAIGLLGMMGVIIKTFASKLKLRWLVMAGFVILLMLGVRSWQRGLDYYSQETLSLKDIAVTEQNYLAMNNLAKYYINNDDLKKAEFYAKQSIEFFPAVTNYNNLGVIYQKQNDFVGAKREYMSALNIVPLGAAYENVAITNLVIGESTENIKFLQDALRLYPNNNRLWTYLAIEEAAANNNDAAKTAIMNAYRTGPIPPALYTAIIDKTPLDIPILDSGKVVQIIWE